MRLITPGSSHIINSCKCILLGVAVLILVAASFCGSVLAQSTDKIEQNGFVIQGDFLTFYRAAPDSLLLLGYPISNEFIDTETNIRVQYFQRARLESVSGTVRLTALGSQLQEQFQKDEGTLPASFEGAGCRDFENGYRVCYSFLEFYNTYHSYIGEPISDALVTSDNRFVQYFELARLEWHPELPAGERVVLTDLGRIDYDLKPHPLPSDVGSSITNGSLPKSIKLQTHAFVTRALIPVDEQQTLYIIVEDQNYAPVKGASVAVIVYSPKGHEEYYRPADTNEHGISQLVFSVAEATLKETIRVEVIASYQTDSGPVADKTKTWFRIWW